ncbi:uncharacterized protein BDV17DRAFT_160315 [Aspergillus undulatus]|uniref:uncharacterized protein n=1 Tax=Aspergillus undulatus TaxID=1810928 RepID=UPI003CCE4956
MAERFLRDESAIAVPPARGTTPIQVAVMHGNLGIVSYLLGLVKRATEVERPIKLLDIIVANSEDGEPTLALATYRTTDAHQQVERRLWTELQECIETIPQSFVSFPRRANVVLELAARLGVLGTEGRLLNIFQIMARQLDHKPNQEAENALFWAIDLQRPVEVWWLLTKGAYMGEGYFSQAMSINNCYETQGYLNYLVIRDLLLSSPPVLKPRTQISDSELPSFTSTPSKHDQVMGAITGSIISQTRFNFD